MKCRTFEIDQSGFPEESKRFQNLFDAIKNYSKEATPNFIYTLIDNFPETFTRDENNNLLIFGDVSSPTHIYKTINSSIKNLFGGTSYEDFIELRSLSEDKHVVILNIDNIGSKPTSEDYSKIVPELPVKTIQKIALDTTIKVAEKFKNPPTSKTPKEKFTKVPSIDDQINLLKEAFEGAGIKVTVKTDTTLADSEGNLIKGKATVNKNKEVEIILNPAIMTNDTHIHEFSHILIELLGSNNTLIKDAITYIRKTDLYQKVKKAYPELSEAALDKEVLVTAMGLKGAERLEEKSFLRTTINKFIRAIKNFFKVDDFTVDLLVNKLLSKRLEPIDFNNLIESEFESRKVSNKLKERTIKVSALVDQIGEILTRQLDKLESMLDQSTVLDDRIVLIKANISNLYKNDKKIKSLQGFLNFVDYLDEIVKENDNIINKLLAVDKSVLKDENRLKYLQDLYLLSTNIYDMMGPEKDSPMVNLKNAIIIKNSKNTAANKNSSILTDMEEKIISIASKMENQKKYYLDIGAQLHSDLLLGYIGPNIGSELDILIDNVKTYKRVIMAVAEKHPKYKELKDKFKKKEITEEKYKYSLHKYTLEELEKKRLGSESLANELREAQKDKSSYSALMDPIMYSSQVTLQLFASLVKEKHYQANEDTKNVANRLAPAYRKYADAKGADINPVSFNSDILEEHIYYINDPKTGGKKKMTMLSLVQPYIGYEEAEYKMSQELRKKYNVPKRDDKEYKTWKKSLNAKKYYLERARWYAANGVSTEKGRKDLTMLQERLKNIEESIKMHAPGGSKQDPTKYSLFTAQKMDVLSKIGRIYDRKNKQFKGEAIRPSDKYLNPRFSELIDAYSGGKFNPDIESWKAKSSAGEYYLELLKAYHEHQAFTGKQIPTKNSWDKYSYVLPSIEAEGLERLQKDNYNVFKSTKDYFQRGFNFLSTDDSFGSVINANKEQRHKIVPVFYISPTESKFVSHDVGTTILLFCGMANLYKRKSEINGAVMVMRDLVEERPVLETTYDGIPFISNFGKKIKSKRQQRSSKDSNNLKHLSSFIDTHFFGESEIATQINLFGRTLSANKLVNKLITYSALNTLAANVLQAGNQLIIDELRIAEEAIAKEFYDAKNLTWAKGEYTKLLFNGELIKDSGKYNSETKIANFIQDFDLLGDALGEYSDKRTGNRLLKAASMDKFFILQHMAEHETAITRGLAIADSYKGKLKDKDGNVIKNSDGKDANLYDVYVQNSKGGWELDPKVANFKKIHFINRVSAVYKKTNQIKNKLDDPAMNREWWGKALLLYRKYFQPGLRRRWGYGDGMHMDIEGDTISEGTYISLGRYLKNAWKGKLKLSKEWGELSPLEKRNVKRASTELGLYIAATVISGILIGNMDDDEEEDYANNYFAYQAIRVSKELTQFANPVEFARFALSPSALTRSVFVGIELIGRSLEYGAYSAGIIEGEDVLYKQDTNMFEKGDPKILKTFFDFSPILRGIYKSTTPEEGVKFFQSPPWSMN